MGIKDFTSVGCQPTTSKLDPPIELRGHYGSLKNTTVTHRTAAKMARVVDLFKNLLAKNIREPKGITGRVVLVSYKYCFALLALCEKSYKLIIVKFI